MNPVSSRTAGPDDAERVRLGAAEATALSLAVLRGFGYPADDATLIARHVLDAALCGYEYSGLPKLLNVGEQLAAHPVAGPIATCHETLASARFDGNEHNGMVAVDRITDVAIAKARLAGFAVVGVNRTWMSGRSAYYVERIARAGLVGLHTVGSVALAAPPGAARKALGTNPIAFGFPTAGEPLLIDIGLSALMVTDLRLRARRGERLPEGTAIDAAGRPTRDPVAALAGAVLLFGGHKGFALALAMQVMGVLGGAGEADDGAGYVVIAFQPELMLPLERFRQQVSRMIAELKATPRQPGVDSIRIPSERALAERCRAERDGIEIDRAVHERLRLLAAAEPPGTRLPASWPAAAAGR
ncbi:MAG: Ldh family oxidoreductase [Lautropia sp.]